MTWVSSIQALIPTQPPQGGQILMSMQKSVPPDVRCARASGPVFLVPDGPLRAGCVLLTDSSLIEPR